MSLNHHYLHREFPEYHDQIHGLKMNNPAFKAEFDRYEQIDREIYRTETGTEGHSDAYLEELKVERVQLKDRLYHMLREAAS